VNVSHGRSSRCENGNEQPVTSRAAAAVSGANARAWPVTQMLTMTQDDLRQTRKLKAKFINVQANAGEQVNAERCRRMEQTRTAKIQATLLRLQASHIVSRLPQRANKLVPTSSEKAPPGGSEFSA